VTHMSTAVQQQAAAAGANPSAGASAAANAGRGGRNPDPNQPSENKEEKIEGTEELDANGNPAAAADPSNPTASGQVTRSQRPPRKPGERGRMHSFRVASSRFIIDARYTPLKSLGHGAYGIVCSAYDMDTGKKVAIKKIPSAFDDLVDAKRILREVKMLHHFKHENVVGLLDLIDPPPHHPFEDIYIVLDFMETDLHKIIYSRNRLTDEHIQYFMYQALRGLKYIHSANVIHRDLKPSNLLLNGNCDLKICDFGLARGVGSSGGTEANELTEYVVTRWYRAPEVMYSVQDYTYQIDVWALGCILAELHGRKPLFPGQDYIKQMNLIFDVIGTPSEEDMKFISNARALAYIKSLPPKPKVPFSQLYPHASELALDLLDKMLVFNPHRRITVDEALAHPYFADLRVPESETTCPKPFDFSFENVPATKQVLQQFMWDEIYDFRPFLRGVRGQGRPLTPDGKTSSVTGGVPNPDLPPGSGPHAPPLPPRAAEGTTTSTTAMPPQSQPQSQPQPQTQLQQNPPPRPPPQPPQQQAPGASQQPPQTQSQQQQQQMRQP